MDFLLSRRQTLFALFLIGTGSTGCRPASVDASPDDRKLPDEDATDPPKAATGDAVDALFDVFIPTEAGGSAGAREAGADKVMATKGFARIAIMQGLLPQLPDDLVTALEDERDAVRTALNADLDLLAQAERPLARFAELPRDRQEAIVDKMMNDTHHRPTMLALRAACFFAWLGGFTSDDGLRAIGFPKFEDLTGGLACSGYPRSKKTGHLVDPATENLSALAASGDLDDYTYALAPVQTAGVDLSQYLDPNGDLP